MKNKLFCWFYLLLLLLPAATMNLKNDSISEIDNTYLPQFSFSAAFLKEAGNYIEKRIGGREQAIWMYEKINDVCFNVLEHPNYMYGEEGHIYCKDESYMKDFQHLNTKEKIPGGGYNAKFADYIKALEETAQENGTYFLYILCTDKKTIYPEYFPDGVNVLEQKSRSELILSELEKRNINYLYSKKRLLEEKQRGIDVYNRKFDVGHWNDQGAFVFVEEVFHKLQEKFPELSEIKKEDFYVGTKVEPYLLTSKFKINESVPDYKSKINNAIQTDQYSDRVPGNHVYYSHFVNSAATGPSILVFRDSYFDRASKFFIEYFSEATFASYGNLTSLADYEEYINILKPDIVIFENVERTFPISINK